MLIRHLVERQNVDPAGCVRDPRAIRHGLIVGRRVAALAGPIDPATHLNRDFPGHRADVCIVVEAFVIGAPVVLAGDGFATARVPPAALAPLGPVDLAARRRAWAAVARRGGSGRG